MITLLLALMTFHPAHAGEAACFETGKTCSDVDIDRPRAEEAYRKGCDANDFYSCARLGQFYEVKENNLEKAAPFYDRACKGKDEFGCSQSQDLHQRLCFLEGDKHYCDGREPAGEMRIYVYLTTFSPKYADAFRDHNFDRGWGYDQVEKLFRKRVKERNGKLLRVLQKEWKSRRHDGADGETLDYYIKCLKDRCPVHPGGERAYGTKGQKD